MKKFTLVSLARTKKSATSALMGLAILFVTLNFVSATLSIKVCSSNPNFSDGAGIQNNGTADGAFPFWETGLPDDEATARMMLEDDNFPRWTTRPQNNDAAEEQNLSLNTVDRPASTYEFFRKDLNLLDSEDSLYGHFSFLRPNLTKTLSEKRFDDPSDQEKYKSALSNKNYFYNDDSSYSEGGSFHPDGSPNILAQSPDISSPPTGLFGGNNRKRP